MICANLGCEIEFEKTTHNQKYCSDACCREATNRKNKNKYYEEKRRLSGETRICKTKGCENKLSRYNPEKFCSFCQSKKDSESKQELLRIMNVTR